MPFQVHFCLCKVLRDTEPHRMSQVQLDCFEPVHPHKVIKNCMTLITVAHTRITKQAVIQIGKVIVLHRINNITNVNTIGFDFSINIFLFNQFRTFARNIRIRFGVGRLSPVTCCDGSVSSNMSSKKPAIDYPFRLRASLICVSRMLRACAVAAALSIPLTHEKLYEVVRPRLQGFLRASASARAQASLTRDAFSSAFFLFAVVRAF